MIATGSRSTRSLAGRALVNGAAAMLIAQIARLSLQALYFVVIARVLGPSGMGTFVGVLAFVSLVVPFASVGSGQLLIRDGVRDPESMPIAWGNALLITSTTGFVLVLCLTLIGGFVFAHGASVATVAAVGSAELIFARYTELAWQAYQAVGRLRRTGQIQVALSAARLLAAVLMGISPELQSPSSWAFLYLGATALVAAAAMVAARLEITRAAPRPALIPQRLREGVFFSIGLSAQSIYNDIDKTMLLRIATADAVGIYAAAYRLIEMAFTPVRSLLYAAYAEIFRRGADGPSSALHFIRRPLAIGVCYSTVSGIALWLLAPAVTLVLGEGYGSTVFAIRLLASLPLLKCLHYFAGDLLAGLGDQAQRSIAQILIAALNVALNLIFLPRFSWRGASVVSVACDALLAAALWWLVILATRSHRGALSSTEKLGVTYALPAPHVEAVR
jgi:O-antigen/teichoic acid export membrane protein